MTRSDIHRDAVLRRLGVTYYESLHGAATAADVSRALDSVRDTTSEHSGTRAAAWTAGPHARGAGKQHHGRWHHRVGDVMTTSVVTADRRTPFKEIAARMAEHKISAVPVLALGRHVAGVVSESDLLSVQEKHAREAQLESGGRLHWHTGDKRHLGLTAGELMTTPAITIHPDATLPAAARLMNSRDLKLLPVVEADTAIGGGIGGKLIGIVSRRDLLSVFLRPDADIIRDVGQVLGEIAGTDPKDVIVAVHHGVVTLTGTMRLEPGDRHDLVPLAVRLVWDIDGVVDVVNRLTETKAEQVSTA
jgi:CBS domain-containing protein